MFLKFSKLFICFLLLTVFYQQSAFSAENENKTTAQNASNKTIEPTKEETKKETDSSNINKTDEKDATPDEFSDEKSKKDFSTKHYFQPLKKDPVQKKAPIVDTSEISKAIDDDYSFLYDPNMRPEIITDMANNPDNYVIIYLETGDTILIRLKPEIAPNTVVRFKRLVKEHFYDDMEIFRAIPDFLVQTGDPSGSGYGGKGIFYFAEIDPNEKFKRGTVAMSNNGNLQSDDTQFFITFNSFDWLDGKYTIFGEVIMGVNKLENTSKSLSNDGFVVEPTIITKVELLSQRPADRVDSLSKIIPQEQQKAAIKKQTESKRREEAKQQFLIENEKQKTALREEDRKNKEKEEKKKASNDNNENADKKEKAPSNPYLGRIGR